MNDVDGIDGFEDEIAALERSIGGATTIAATFDAEMQRMQATLNETTRATGTLSRGISRGLKGAIDGLIFDGDSLSDALKGVAQSMANAAYSAAIKPVTNHFGGMIATGIEGLVGAMSGFERGAGFAQGRVIPFATGGIVSGPVTFPMRGGLGLMGEAGPEAILPLSRGVDGRLGVRAESGGRAVNVVMNVTTPNVEGFQRSRSQIAAQLARALSRGQRNY